jgi:hypothetical protein
MIYFEAPEKVDVAVDSLFLAGGISGCPDWQGEAVRMLKGTSCAVLNPRRSVFPIGDRAAMAEQVAWEYVGLRMASVILFWFPRGEVQPIALYELGTAVASCKLISVGADPEYSRRVDLELQLEVAQVGGRIYDSLEDTVRNAIGLIGE